MVSLQQLQGMDPYDFEELVAEVWEAKGYDTHVRQGSQDRAIDVEAVQGGQRILIQAKRYSSDNKVGSEDVRKYATLYQQEPDANRVIVVTTSTFTSEAKRVAAEQNVSIIDGPSFVEMMEEEEVEDGSATKEESTDSLGGVVRHNSPDGLIGKLLYYLILSPFLIAGYSIYYGFKILAKIYKGYTATDTEHTESDTTSEEEQPTD